MWVCETCGADNEDIFDVCLECKNPTKQTNAGKNSTDEEISYISSLDATELANQNEKFSSTYKTARLIAKIVSFIGWVVVGIALLHALYKLTQSHHGLEYLGLMAAIAEFITGIILVALGQLTRATVDNADYSASVLEINKQMLSIMKKQQDK